MDIKKTTGEVVPFKEDKFYTSMRSAGIEHSLAQEVLRMVTHEKNNLISTDALHSATQQVLVEKNELALAARYNLKRAIVDLGPSGYPFEQFIAHVFRAYGYEAKTNQTIQGKCVQHEVDVVAEKEGMRYMIECKHHHFSGAKTNVKVSLYVYARFLDVSQSWSIQDGKSVDQYKPWLVTNTKMTSDAIAYAECVGMKLLAWHYPRHKGLNELIEFKQLYPVTVLPYLSKKINRALIQNNIVMAAQVKEYQPDALGNMLKIKPDAAANIIRAAHELLT